jgi:hypothetical protein
MNHRTLKIFLYNIPGSSGPPTGKSPGRPEYQDLMGKHLDDDGKKG